MTKKLSSQLNNGFTLIETLVAISILMVAVVAPMSFASMAIKANSFAKERLILFYQARGVADQALYKYNHDDSYDIYDYDGVINGKIDANYIEKGGDSYTYEDNLGDGNTVEVIYHLIDVVAKDSSDKEVIAIRTASCVKNKTNGALLCGLKAE